MQLPLTCERGEEAEIADFLDKWVSRTKVYATLIRILSSP